MTASVRRIYADEMPLLLALREEVLREVFELASDADMSALLTANRRYYEARLASGEHVACFAYEEGQILGCGGACFHSELPSPENPSGQCAYLMNIYVRAHARRRGVGRQIVCWLIERAREQGVGKIYLESSNAAKGLYEKLGFAEMGDMMIYTGE